MGRAAHGAALLAFDRVRVVAQDEPEDVRLHRRWMEVHEFPLDREPYASEAWKAALEIRKLATDTAAALRKRPDALTIPPEVDDRARKLLVKTRSTLLGRKPEKIVPETVASLNRWQAAMKKGADPQDEGGEVLGWLEKLQTLHSIATRPVRTAAPVETRPVVRVTAEPALTKNKKPATIVLVGNKRRLLPDGQVKALLQAAGHEKGKPKKDAVSDLYRWLKVHSLPSTIERIDVRDERGHSL